MADIVGDGGGSGEPERGVPVSSSSVVGDVGDWLEAFELARFTFDDLPLVVDLIEPASDLSPEFPSSVARAPAEGRELSTDFSLSALELPGILDRIEPLKDREDPCVSDLLKDGKLDKESGVRLVEEEFLGVREPSLLLDCCWPITNDLLLRRNSRSALMPVGRLLWRRGSCAKKLRAPVARSRISEFVLRKVQL